MRLIQQLSSWRSRLRLGSGLVLLSFVISHLSAHALLLVSFETAEATRAALMYPWRTAFGTALMLLAALVHFSNALISIYLRRSLRLPRWEWGQITLGLCIPALLMFHVVSTRIAEILLNVNSFYSTVLIVQWLMFPWLAAVQITAVLALWVHACIGIHFWCRTKRWYPQWRAWFYGFSLLLPTLALAGYVTAGNQVLREAKNPDYAQLSLDDSNLTEQALADITQITLISLGAYLALVLMPFAARLVRWWHDQRLQPPLLAHPSGRPLPMLRGATVLETLRANGIPHASVCGGRARCTTCRVLVTKGLDLIAAPSALETLALARIGATPGMRLACQLCPSHDLSVMPLLAADASAADGATRGGLEGSERPITVVFVDMRGSTALGEARMPYDVLFILNQFFHEMTKALVATSGHYSQFTGDGLMALYGLDSTDPAVGAADAVRGAREMLWRLERLNLELKGYLSEPLRIGIGIHHSEAIVGAMGPPAPKSSPPLATP